MPSELDQTFIFIKKEVVAIQGLWQMVRELFYHDDPKRLQVMERTAPLFFGLVHSTFLESLLIRIARLMDPPKTNKFNNNSYSRLFDLAGDDALLTKARKDHDRLKNEWERTSFDRIRNKVLAHNDVAENSMADHTVSLHLTLQDVQDLEKFVLDLFIMQNILQACVGGGQMLNRPFSTIGELPQAVIKNLAGALCFQQLCSDEEIVRHAWAKFEFSKVGEEGIRGNGGRPVFSV